VRLQVYLSKAGVASRRSNRGIIESGRVSVNDKKVTDPSFRVDPAVDSVTLDGKKIILRDAVYIALNKPKGIVTTKKDRFAEKTIMDLLPKELGHLNPVGRLDKDTRGLVLMTNDGDLINRLTHPRFNVEKTYSAVLDRDLDKRDKAMLEKGVPLEGKATSPCKIIYRTGNEVEITIHEGRNRQVRRMFGAAGYRVFDLKRIKEADLTLGSLPEGKWRFLNKGELRKICATACVALCFLSLSMAEGGGSMKLTSPEFSDKEFIPGKFTCQGENVSPALNIESVPAGTRSLALIVDDPDAPMGTWTHWVVFNIPVVPGIDESGIPGSQGVNDFGKMDYGGPCPPSGTHRYFFRLYALDILLELDEGADRESLEAAMKGHILDSAELVGLYKKTAGQ